MAEEDKRIFLAMDEVAGQRQQDGKTNGVFFLIHFDFAVV